MSSKAQLIGVRETSSFPLFTHSSFPSFYKKHKRSQKRRREHKQEVSLVQQEEIEILKM